MTLILFIILVALVVCYFTASVMAMFEYVVPDQGYNYDSKLESKRSMIAILLIPVAPIIGPYFIYKALKG